jgi:hypothetical protein
MIVSGMRWGVVLALGAGACAAPASAPPGPPRPPLSTSRGAPQSHPSTPAPPSYEAAIAAIAADIERLRVDYPQLSAFRAGEHCDPRRLVIEYSHRTHRAQHRGGWTSGVPNPDADGLWFYIDFHAPDSQAQIHTQPVVRELRYRDKRVMVLILEGARTRSIAGRLQQILRAHGARSPEAPPAPAQGQVQ